MGGNGQDAGGGAAGFHRDGPDPAIGQRCAAGDIERGVLRDLVQEIRDTDLTHMPLQFVDHDRSRAEEFIMSRN